MTLPVALQALTAYRQFVIYKLVPLASGKTDKLPVDYRTMQVFTKESKWQDDPNAWTDSQTASSLAAVMGDGYGVGFFVTHDDPFFFIDIDNCLQSDGQWSPVAVDLCNRLPGAAVEISQSGKGLHIFGTYTRAPAHSCKNATYNIEMYTGRRFAALTGDGASGDAGTDCTAALAETAGTYFPAGEAVTPTEWSDGPDPDWSGPADDDVLIQKMLAGKSAANVFGSKASLKDLWEGNEVALSLSYPSLNEVDPYDRSSADAALAQHLAWWTGKDHERIHRLMMRSALVRDKWTKHKAYLRDMTITRAVSMQTGVYHGKSDSVTQQEPSKPVVIIEATVDSKLTVGNQFLTPTQLQEYFKDCVYIQDRHRMLTASGAIIPPDQFKATMGGYEFAMDNENGRTTRNAWEAFVENQAVRFPKVSTTCFRPLLPPRVVINEENQTMVNTHIPIITKRTVGDASPFLRHMDNLFPDVTDLEIIMTYMSSLVQNPGIKFQWCPMIQGCQGNGKSLLATVLTHAVGRRFTHKPSAANLGNPFNGWVLEKKLIIIEEIFTSHKRELGEWCKPLITDDRVEVQPKGVDQFTADNMSNWITFTNHKDAIIITIDDRRYAPFFTPHQSNADIIAAGMGGDYFPKIYHWLKYEQGLEIVNEFLHTRSLSVEYDPAGACQRAPRTTSLGDAVDLSVGGIEQEILEAISQDRPGFANGWISSNSLDKLLVSLKAERQIPINKRRTLLQSLGYDWHPALKDGRTNTVVIAESSKPRLFIQKDHMHRLALTTPNEVVKTYIKAQGYPANLNQAQGAVAP